jgi:hypothetical protein
MKANLKNVLFIFFMLNAVISNGQSATYRGFGWIDIGWQLVKPQRYTVEGSANFTRVIAGNKINNTVKINYLNVALSSGQNMTLMTYGGFILSQHVILNGLSYAHCLGTWTVGYEVERNFSADVSLTGNSVGSSGFSYGANFNAYYHYSASDSGSQVFDYYYSTKS